MSMIAWYPLNGTLDDSLGTTIPSGSGISFTRSGKISTNAPDFNGASSFIDTGLQQSSLGRNFSISAWLYAEDSSNYRDAIGRHNNGGNGGFVFGEFNSGNLAFCIFSSKDSTLDNSVVGYSTTLPLNEWHHFVMVVKDLKTMAIYEDGILLKSATGSTDMNPIGTILIGKSYGSADRFWDGMIQDIRIYDECLTDHEIKELSKALILGLDFSDSYATDTEYDISGFKRNLENHGCTETYDSDEKKYVANFDGSSNYMVMKDQTYKSATKAITIIARVYCAAVNGYKTVMSSADGEGGIQFLPSNINEYIVNFLLSTGSSYSGYGNRPGYYGKWSTVAMTFDGKTVKTYIDGKINSTNTLSSSAEIVYSPTSYMFFGCDSGTTKPSSSYNKMKLEYFKIYSTALSSDDIKKEYSTSELIDKSDGIESRDILETGDNIAFCVDDGIASKTWGSGIGISPEGSTTVNGTSGLTKYAQANCQVTLTDDGYRIYRTPNIVYDSTKGWGGGTSSWGGFRWQPFAYSADLIQKDHSYVIMFHVHGFTDNAMLQSPLVWSNNMDWSGGGLIPTPTNESRHTVPANFNGDMECYYAFTVSDDIYKTCTTSYASYVAGTKYLSYRDFCAGFGYSSTGTNGTDIYITNFRMYDVTGWTDDKVQMLKNGTLEALSVSEDDSLGNDSPVAIYKDGNVSAKRIKTF